nr:MAG TPA: hypothetical protein [Caudoviricetes sp.]
MLLAPALFRFPDSAEVIAGAREKKDRVSAYESILGEGVLLRQGVAALPRCVHR